MRFAEPHLNTSHHISDVDYYFLVIKENLVLCEGKEKHTVRFYFPEEIKFSVEKSNFQLIRLCTFLELDGTPNEKTWNVTASAQAVKDSIENPESITINSIIYFITS